MIRKPSTKELLARSLAELMAELPFEDISVQLLTTNCGTSRQTFYKHFADKYALVCYIFSRQLVSAADSVSRDLPWRASMAAMLRVLPENAAFYGRLMRVDSLVVELVAPVRDFFSEYAAAQLDGKPLTMEMDFAIDFFCVALVYKMSAWVRRGFKETPEALAEYIESCLPAPLRPLFCQRARRMDYGAYEHGQR